MFLPNMKLTAKLCGATSIGDVILPSEKKGLRGENGAAHKILRDIFSGQPVSNKRLLKLLYVWVGQSKKRGLSIPPNALADVQKKIESAPSTEQLSPDEIALEVWNSIYETLPDTVCPKTKNYLHNLLAASQSTNTLVVDKGANALFEFFSDADDPSWSSWFEFAVQPLRGSETIPDDISEAFKILGVLGLALVFLAESIENEDLDPEKKEDFSIKIFKLLFAVKDGQPHPHKSVARLLEYALEESEFETKIEFIRHAFNSSEDPEICESQVREAKRYFSGSAIPTYKKTKNALEVSGMINDGNRRDFEWMIMMAQLVARSHRHLDNLKSGPIPDKNKPHFLYYEMMRAHVEARPAPITPSN